jgi:hypothetical protein
MFLLVIYKDLAQKNLMCIIKFKKMKTMIKKTNGLISYNTIRQRHDKKYITKQNLYQVVKI